MRGLLPGGAVGLFIGYLVGRIYERLIHARRAYASADKAHGLTTKALETAGKLQAALLRKVILAFLGAAFVIFLLISVALTLPNSS
jgi:hypothetical protein